MRRGDEEGRPTGGEGVGVSRALEEIVGEVPRDAYGAGEGGKLEWHGAVVEVGAVAVPGAEIGMARVEVGSIEGEDAVFAERLGTTSPAFPDLNYTPGTPFDAPEFPVLYAE